MALTQGKGATASTNLLNVLRGVGPLTGGPATFYLALLSTMPTASDGTGAVELTGNGYARVAITAASGSWSAPALQPDNATMQIANSAALATPAPTAAWVAAVGFALYDAASGGNLWYFDTFANPVTGQTGVPIQFNANAITVGEK